MKTMLSLAKFIEFPNIDNFSAPIFKKQFSLKELPQSATLEIITPDGYIVNSSINDGKHELIFTKIKA